MNVPKYQDSGRLIGYGHINFDSAEAVEKVKLFLTQALAFDGKDFGGRYLRVDKARGPKESKKSYSIILSLEVTGEAPSNCLSVFVKGLPFKTTEEEFKHFFTDCGEITSCRIVFNSQTGLSKGFLPLLIPDSDTLTSRPKKQSRKQLIRMDRN